MYKQNKKDLELAATNSSLKTGIENANTNTSLSRVEKKINLKEREIVLNEEQQAVFKKMETYNYNMFITGKPGTGKSELLKQFVKTTKKKVVVLAPTGVAALNVGGKTINSFFKLDPKINFVEELKPGNISPHLKDLLKKVDTIIIDEISMVAPNLMDIIDCICKFATGSISSFGGKQLICFGDLYQLLPVVIDDTVKAYLKREYGGMLFYRAHAFENNNFIDDNSLKIYELTHIFRQNDEKFKNVLNEIRIGNISQEILDTLNKQVINEEEKEDVITLTATNAVANIINKSKLDEIKSKEFTFKATVTGKRLPKQYPTSEELHLKVGAQVIMITNDSNGRWVNGTMGVISSLKKDEIKVIIDNMECSVEKYKWENSKYVLKNGELTQEVIGVFKQYPIKLAWAVTIHKAQGQTYKSVLIDLGTGAFATGQTYVALSRCISLETLYLRRPIKFSDITVNQEAVDFMRNAKILKLGGEN